MKIYIMTDMEGISGIRRPEQTDRNHPSYQEARHLLAADVNAAIDGAFAGGATEVWVCDSHGAGFNFPIEEMDPRATYVENGGLFNLMGQLDETFAGFFAVGYHAMAGTPQAFIDHTMSNEIFEFRVNGRPTGEIGAQVYLAGHLGVPQLLVTGDEAACKEALALTPGIETVAVKRAYQRFRAECIHPKRAREMIRQAAQRAVALAGRIQPVKLAPPITVEITFVRTDLADVCVTRKLGVERVDGRTVRMKVNSASEILALF